MTLSQKNPHFNMTLSQKNLHFNVTLSQKALTADNWVVLVGEETFKALLIWMMKPWKSQPPLFVGGPALVYMCCVGCMLHKLGST
jgi:hypothetical protein